jgi:ABC-type nitrate/sulfonate/bicarbonate transport system permease component
VPPLILFLGVDYSLKITVVAMGCFFPIFINTLARVEGIDDVLLQTARTFRTGRVRTLTRVVSSGLGYYIVQMQYAMKPEVMYAAIATLALTG